MKDYLFTVIIVTYNCLPYLKKCINSIYEFNDIGNELQVIVVDNGNDDGETEFWLKLNHSNVEYIKSENKGFGYGNNVGYRKAKGQYLLFLNPDTELVEPIFEFAVSKFIADNNLGCFGVQLIDSDMRKTNSFGIRTPTGLIKTLFGNILLSLNIFIPSLMFPMGADIFIRKSDFESIGLFDENIFMYFEEADICNRINKISKRVAIFKEKKIIHKEGKTSKFDFVKYYIKQLGSKIYYCEKYGKNKFETLFLETRYCRIKLFAYYLMNNKQKYDDYLKIYKYLKSTD